MAFEDIRNERLKKLALLEAAGFNVYPASTLRTHAVSEAQKNFSKFEKAQKRIVLTGRVMALREHGGSTFANLKDESGVIQFYLKEDEVGQKEYRLFLDGVDVGDFVEISGKLFKTKRGEETLEVSNWRILVKSLRPLPEKWHGLQDVEERFRKRYLNLIMNDEAKAKFLQRAKLVNSMRSFFEKSGFTEFETPLLHPLAGGALARPFKTHHNALDTDFYLRIAPELYLKRLLVGGFEKVFELGRNFRNEGLDATHNSEFTMLEAYAAWWDEEGMMKFVEELFVKLVKEFFKSGKMEYDGKKFSVKSPFKKITFKDLLKCHARIEDYDNLTRDSMATRARELDLGVSPHESKGKIADEIYKKVCRPHLIEPTFVTRHPIDISPLAKELEEKPDEVRRFQLIVAGLEVANAFSELNNPIEQRKRFEAQEREKKGGEEEAHPLDEDFIEAMEYGMPPAAGLGIGIDRLAMLFTNTHNIKEVILFPTMKPKH
ncbi:MAG: lysine--tRNA ligase [bacterium]|nr:lysine--tRNA ligase [bacterium]